MRDEKGVQTSFRRTKKPPNMTDLLEGFLAALLSPGEQLRQRRTPVNLLPIPEIAKTAAASFESFQRPFAGPQYVSAAEKPTQFGGFLRFLSTSRKMAAR